MPKGEKRKEPSQGGLRQTTMGSFFSLSGSKSSKKSDKVSTSKKETKLPPERFGKRRMWGNWAARDTEEYRDRYPGKKEFPNRRDNLLFYTNELRSKPDGDYIDDIHEKWYGDYERLERHHGYIQWLFPIRESGLNWHAQELQLHEIDAILKDAAAKKRVLTSYKMMLDFYGMQLKDEETGVIVRADNWKPRFRHLNRSFHNYLRITRILKCLGEFDYEYLKPPFIKFILEEAFVHRTLDNLLESCERYWIGVLRDEKAREEVWNYYEDLYIKAQQSEENQEKQEDMNKQSAQGKKDKTRKENVSDVDVDFDSDNETLDTLEYAIDMNNSLEEGGTETKETTEKTRKAHTISDSDEDGQEARYWENENNKGASSQIVEDASLGSDAIEGEQGMDKENRDAKGGEETEFDALIVIDSEDVGRKSKSRKTGSGDDIVNEIGKDNKSNNTMNLKSSESETVLAGVNELSEHSDTPMNDNENKQSGIATDGANDKTPQSQGSTQVNTMEKSDVKASNNPTSNSTTESIENEITEAMKDDIDSLEDKTNTAGKVISEDNMDMNVEANIANKDSASDIKGGNEGGQEDQMDTDFDEITEEPMES